ncbi:MAG: hypothetical protein NTW21_03120 [Verrucomicrobia bacterium]|nr:hypothetical protein [Verrucomicrobiota bacterium]
MQDMKRRDFLGAGLGAMMGSPLLLAQGGTPADADLKDDAKKQQVAAKSLRHFRFGVNYTPTKNWFFFWNDFDADAVARDLDAIASLGMDHLRIFALWPHFQPKRTLVSPEHLKRLDQFMRLTAQRKLDVCVSMLNGWIANSVKD